VWLGGGGWGGGGGGGVMGISTSKEVRNTGLRIPLCSTLRLATRLIHSYKNKQRIVLRKFGVG